MKKLILPLLPLLLISCKDSTSNSVDYDNTADIEFLEQNALQEDVTVTDSGLQYRVIEEGDGEFPDASSTVRVHYTGTFITGDVFDSSLDRDPAVFALNEVIAGWTEGLQLMKEGSTYEFVIPSHLAYGDNQVGPIYPGATLIFEVTLIEIVE